MRIRMCVGINICAFFCSECCMHFTGVLGTRAWAGVYVTHGCLYTNVHICKHTRYRLCTYVYMCVYACICTWMRMCVYDIAWHVDALLLRFSVCAYVCVCMRMYMCVHVCVYRCMCICIYMYICMSVYMYAYTFIYARMWVYICTRVGAFCLFVLSNLSTHFLLAWEAMFWQG